MGRVGHSSLCTSDAFYDRKKMTNMFDPYMYPNSIDLDVKCEHEFLTIRENYSRTDWVPEAYHGQRGKVIKSVFPKAFITGSASFLLEFENEERMWISSLSVQEYMFPWEKKEKTSQGKNDY